MGGPGVTSASGGGLSSAVRSPRPSALGHIDAFDVGRDPGPVLGGAMTSSAEGRTRSRAVRSAGPAMAGHRRSGRWRYMASGLWLLVLVCYAPGVVHAEIVVPDGFAVEVFFAGPPLETIRALVVSPGGTLYVADRGGLAVAGDSRLISIDVPTRSASVLLSDLPLTGALDEVILGDGRPLLGTDLIVADHNSEETKYCCDGRVLRVNRNSGCWITLSQGNPAFDPPGDPCGLALAPAGGFLSGLYVMDFEGDSPHPPVLYRINDDGSRDVVLVAPDVWTVDRTPQRIDFAPLGSSHGPAAYVSETSAMTGAAAVWKITPTLELSEFIAGTTLRDPISLEFAPGPPWGEALLILDSTPDSTKIWAADPQGSLSLFATGLPGRDPAADGGGDLAFDVAGEYLYVGLVDTIFRVSFVGADVPSNGSSDPPTLRVAPNPFSRETAVEFSLPSPEPVTLELFDLRGRLIARERWSADVAPQIWRWNGRASDGTPVGSGVYFLRLTAGPHVLYHALVFIR